MDTINPKNNVKIIKSGFLQKRSKYLKIWKRYNKYLTNQSYFNN